MFSLYIYINYIYIYYSQDHTDYSYLGVVVYVHDVFDHESSSVLLLPAQGTTHQPPAESL